MLGRRGASSLTIALLVACAPSPPAASPPSSPAPSPPPLDASADARLSDPEPVMLVLHQFVAVPDTTVRAMLVEHLYGKCLDDDGRRTGCAWATLRLRGADGSELTVEWDSGLHVALGERFDIVVLRSGVFLYRLPPLPDGEAAPPPIDAAVDAIGTGPLDTRHQVPRLR